MSDSNQRAGTITLLCVLALQPAPSWSFPAQPEELQCRRHHCRPQSPRPHHPINKQASLVRKLDGGENKCALSLKGAALTSVRGSSASRLAAGIWSSLGLFEDDEEDDEEDVVWSAKFGQSSILSYSFHGYKWSLSHLYYLLITSHICRRTNLLVPSLWSSHVQLHALVPPAPCGSHGHGPPQHYPE